LNGGTLARPKSPQHPRRLPAPALPVAAFRNSSPRLGAKHITTATSVTLAARTPVALETTALIRPRGNLRLHQPSPVGHQ
jgi:hypothetical protein